MPDPNFFGGTVEFTERDGTWITVNASERPFRPAELAVPRLEGRSPDEANYRCLGIAELARAVTIGTAHRASGALGATPSKSCTRCSGAAWKAEQ